MKISYVPYMFAFSIVILSILSFYAFASTEAILSNYPNFLYSESSLNTIIVIGASASSADTAPATTIASSLGGGITTKLDSEVTATDKATKNLILVGGPCINSLVEQLASAGTFPYSCSTWPPQDFGLIYIVENAFASGKTAVVVAGTSSQYASLAASVLQGYNTVSYLLKYVSSKAVSITGTTTSPLISTTLPPTYLVPTARGFGQIQVLNPWVLTASNGGLSLNLENRVGGTVGIAYWTIDVGNGPVFCDINPDVTLLAGEQKTIGCVPTSGWTAKTVGDYYTATTVIYYTYSGNQYSTSGTLSGTYAASVHTCTDSDGGKNYYMKGKITGTVIPDWVKVEDGCYLISSSVPVTECSGTNCVLHENWCEETFYAFGNYTCPYGCRDGACLNNTYSVTFHASDPYDYYLRDWNIFTVDPTGTYKGGGVWGVGAPLKISYFTTSGTWNVNLTSGTYYFLIGQSGGEAYGKYSGEISSGGISMSFSGADVNHAIPFTVPLQAANICGNGICESGENTCPSDCGWFLIDFMEPVEFTYRGMDYTFYYVACGPIKMSSGWEVDAATLEARYGGITEPINILRDGVVVLDSGLIIILDELTCPAVTGANSVAKFIVTYETGVECTDSDGGYNYYLKGRTIGPIDPAIESSGRTTVLRDECAGNIINEGVCKDGYAKWVSYTCPGACEYGACVKKTAPVCGNAICEDNEDTCPKDCGWFLLTTEKPLDVNYNGVDYKFNFVACGIIYTTDAITLTVGYNGTGETLQILGGTSKILSNGLKITVNDIACPADGSLEVTNISLSSDYTTCKDSDGGKNYYTKGNVTSCTFYDLGGGCGTLIDYCSGNKLIEGYCENNQSKTIEYACPYGCRDGACIVDFNVTAVTDKYSYKPGEIANFIITLSSNDDLDFKEASVKLRVFGPDGEITELEPARAGAVSVGCGGSSGGSSYTCRIRKAYSFIAKYQLPYGAEMGLYKFIVDASVKGNVRSTSGSFEVNDVYTDYVDVTITPKEQTTIIGEPVSYRVLITDKHPESYSLVYDYDIAVNGLPYNSIYPNRVSVRSGDSYSFELKVFPSPIRTQEGIETAVQAAETSEETQRVTGTTGAFIATGYQTVSGGGGSTAVVPIEVAGFRFTVSASLVDDYAVRDSDSATLYVKYSNIPEPPDFPDDEIITIIIRKGWNLLNLPGRGVGFEDMTCSQINKPFAFVYLHEQRRQMTIQEASSTMGTENMFEYVSLHPMWIYSYEDCSISVQVSNYATYSGMPIVSGWNMIGTTKDMVGETMGSIKGNCEFEKIYRWDAEYQRWESVSEDDLIDTIGNGIVVKAKSDCNLKENSIQPPTV